MTPYERLAKALDDAGKDFDSAIREMVADGPERSAADWLSSAVNSVSVLAREYGQHFAPRWGAGEAHTTPRSDKVTLQEAVERLAWTRFDPTNGSGTRYYAPKGTVEGLKIWVTVDPADKFWLHVVEDAPKGQKGAFVSCKDPRYPEVKARVCDRLRTVGWTE